MDKLRCNICEECFEFERNYYPYSCPLCGAVFCGEECCGAVAYLVEEKEEKKD